MNFQLVHSFDCGAPKCNAEEDILGWTQWAKQMLNPKVLFWQQNTVQMSEQNHGFWQLPNIHSFCHGNCTCSRSLYSSGNDPPQTHCVQWSEGLNEKKLKLRKGWFTVGAALLTYLFWIFFSAEMWQVSEELAGTPWFQACLWGSTGDNDRQRWLISPLSSLF